MRDFANCAMSAQPTKPPEGPPPQLQPSPVTEIHALTGDNVSASGSARGDSSDNDLSSPLEAPPAQEPSSTSFNALGPSRREKQADPRQHLFDALCDNPLLTREDALDLLAIRDRSLADEAPTNVWPLPRIVECVRQPDAARRLSQQESPKAIFGEGRIRPNPSSSLTSTPSVPTLPSSNTSSATASISTQHASSAKPSSLVGSSSSKDHDPGNAKLTITIKPKVLTPTSSTSYSSTTSSGLFL